MKLPKEVIEYTNQLGWYTALRVIGADWDGFPITEEDDVEYFYTEDGEPDYWYGTPIPGTQGYKQMSPEEALEMYNHHILCGDALINN